MPSITTWLKMMLRGYRQVPPKPVGTRCYSYEISVSSVGFELPATIAISTELSRLTTGADREEGTQTKKHNS